MSLERYAGGVGGKSEIQSLLEWELALDSRDLRAHAWYHGNVSRQAAEILLQSDGDFLVRDCTSSGRTGDFVLSCRWQDKNLHFLVHRDVFQPDTIYEKLSYRFENDHFDTVSDLITYHVGSGIPISSVSGALIHSPKTRNTPIQRSKELVAENQSMRGDYVTLMTAEIQPVPVNCRVEKISTLERLRHQSLNLTPPVGLLEELEEIPAKILEICEKFDQIQTEGSESSYDLTTFQSILIPTNKDDVDIQMDRSVLNMVTSRLLEISDRQISLHLTKLDWELLANGSSSENGSDEDIHEKWENELGLETPGIYARLCHNSNHRWNNIIERSFSLSHFVVVTILTCSTPETMLNKWITIANELKTGLGNFFSFCSIMRALLMPQITRLDGKINWMKLRQEFTASTFTFETGLRLAFQGLLRGTESYPPNTTIPDLLSVALVLEDSLEILPVSCVTGEATQLDFFSGHLKDLRLLSNWESVQYRNLERLLQESTTFELDVVLTDIFRTEFHLILLWGSEEYRKMTLKMRCEELDNLIKAF